MQRIYFILLSLSVALALGACSSTSNRSQPASQAPAPKPTATPIPEVPKDKAPEAKNQTTCVRESDSRTIETPALTPKGCKVLYTKFGRAMEVASSRIGPAHCESVRERILKNLEGAGFKCGN